MLKDGRIRQPNDAAFFRFEGEKKPRTMLKKSTLSAVREFSGDEPNAYLRLACAVKRERPTR